MKGISLFQNDKDRVYTMDFIYDVINVITFWRQRCVNMLIHYVHAKLNNPRLFVFPHSHTFYMYIIENA